MEFNIDGLMGKMVSFGEVEDDVKMGVVVGGYLDLSPTGKRSIYLLVDCNDGLCETRATECAV